MEFEIKNTTVYDKDLIIKYNKFYSISYMRKNFLILGVIALGFIVFMLIQENYKYAILIGGLIVMYYLLTILMQKVTVSRMVKKSPLVDNPVTQVYVFTSNKFTVTNDTNTYEVEYDRIKTIKKGRDLFLLKSDHNKSFIVDYNGFESEEDYKTLRKFFIARFNMSDK